ncbi:23S rRNA (pseudouridine(1915)-N(3))-methyltransferase RlmH [Methylocapsa acidiphila]|uniref:23S rRNA (pseudouridine(1915)-N(3))-methyltransferase RlmH n=1 Tax=Methylocapsa acidiphila TaxID=133552 RepID=UPI000405A569|nr:23S rRNA (pseudouridine(1915)-N(3))-methyltransferase RlmH [Methylocapsa acidiphila]
MRLMLACVGRAKAGPERELALRYVERAAAAGRAIGFTALEVREIEESRARRADDRKEEEAKALRALLAPCAAVIAFDEGGKLASSRDFAADLGRRRDEGVAGLGFVIGGPDGLAESFRASAALVLSFGRMSFPHQIARILAAEQIYRAATILSNHPYHRD